MTDIKSPSTIDNKCKTITRKETSQELTVYLDGKIAYYVNKNIQSVRYPPPNYADPLYRGILSENIDDIAGRQHIEEFHYLSPNDRISTRVGSLDVVSDRKRPNDTVLKMGRVDKYIIHNNILQEVSPNVKTLLRYNAPNQQVYTGSERKAVALTKFDPQLGSMLDYFVGSIEGNYTLVSPYDTSEGFTIINKPIYGRAIFRTAPDSAFYLSYERNVDGVLVGEMVRSRLMPYREAKESSEIEGCLSDGTPVYLSYYDPGGSGKSITREEYDNYARQRREIIQGQTGLPNVLTGLLGF